MTAPADTSTSARSTIQGIKIIDADTHLTEPADLWTSRAPAAYKDLVPRIETLPDEGDVWVMDKDIVLGRAGSGSVVNRNNVKVYGPEFIQWPLSESSPAATYVAPRLALMDELGIWGQIVYPNVVGFGGQNISKIADPELRLLCATLYNDAMAEMTEESGGRLNGMALLPWWDLEASLAEVERIHAMGLKGLNTTSDPQNAGLPDLGDPYWEPLWEACTSLDLPINFHIGASQTQMSWFGDAPWPSFDSERKLAVGSAVLYLSNARVISNLIYSGLLERHPGLKFVSVESGVGWIPFLLEALDHQLDESAPSARDLLSMPPSEYFRRQMYACFWFENDGVLDSLRRLGYDNCLFETDFPHPTCLYPDPLGPISETLSGVDYATRAKLLGGNAAKLYNIDISQG